MVNPSDILDKMIAEFEKKASGESLVRVPRLLFGEWTGNLKVVQKELHELAVSQVLGANKQELDVNSMPEKSDDEIADFMYNLENTHEDSLSSSRREDI